MNEPGQIILRGCKNRFRDRTWFGETVLLLAWEHQNAGTHFQKDGLVGAGFSASVEKYMCSCQTTVGPLKIDIFKRMIFKQ